MKARKIALIVVLGVLVFAGCKKKGADKDAIFRGIPTDHACGALQGSVLTCVADDVLYTCVMKDDQGDVFYCAPRERDCER